MKKHTKHFIYGAITGAILLILSYSCSKFFPREYVAGIWEEGICELSNIFLLPLIIFSPLGSLIQNIAIIWIFMVLVMTISYGIIFMIIGALIKLNKHAKHFIYGAITGIILLILSFSCTKFFPGEFCEPSYPLLFPFLKFRQFVPSTIEWIFPVLVMAISYGIIFMIVGTLIQLLRKYKKMK